LIRLIDDCWRPSHEFRVLDRGKCHRRYDHGSKHK